MMLTVYLLKSGKMTMASKKRCIESLGKLPTELVHMEYGPRFDDFMPSTKFKMFIYDDEIVHENLYEAIPQFLRFDHYDFLSMYKREMRDGEEKVFVAPRIFKSHVRLLRNQLYPENMEDLEGTVILNGWLLDQGVQIQEEINANSLRIPQSRAVAKDNVGDSQG